LRLHPASAWRRQTGGQQIAAMAASRLPPPAAVHPRWFQRCRPCQLGADAQRAVALGDAGADQQFGVAAVALPAGFAELVDDGFGASGGAPANSSLLRTGGTLLAAAEGAQGAVAAIAGLGAGGASASSPAEAGGLLRRPRIIPVLAGEPASAE